MDKEERDQEPVIRLGQHKGPTVSTGEACAVTVPFKNEYVTISVLKREIHITSQCMRSSVSSPLPHHGGKLEPDFNELHLESGL